MVTSTWARYREHFVWFAIAQAWWSLTSIITSREWGWSIMASREWGWSSLVCLNLAPAVLVCLTALASWIFRTSEKGWQIHVMPHLSSHPFPTPLTSFGVVDLMPDLFKWVEKTRRTCVHMTNQLAVWNWKEQAKLIAVRAIIFKLEKLPTNKQIIYSAWFWYMHIWLPNSAMEFIQ